jgi:hypothetical protein
MYFNYYVHMMMLCTPQQTPENLKLFNLNPHTMTSPSLTLGSALLSLSPSLTLFFLIILPKPQLVILSVCAAFAYLISASVSSIVWIILNAIFHFNGHDANGGSDGSSIGEFLALIVPSVFLQCVVRAQFVKLYFGVEDVIRKSVAKHEAENEHHAGNNNTGSNSDAHAETNALQLQLNDTSTSLASGTGYALIHNLFLFGTLLASESNEGSNYYGNINDIGGYYGGGGGSTGHGGTLYQYSCAGMPSLMNGALIGMMFSILDIIWMMLTFFGMRRRQIMQLQQQQQRGIGGGRGVLSCLHDGLSFWKGMDDTTQGGNAALGLVLMSHLLASFVLAPNGIMIEDGCKISLPCLAGVVILVAVLFFRGVKGHFLPMDQRTRIQELRLSGDDGIYHVD